jgi:hypothetical protein
LILLIVALVDALTFSASSTKSPLGSISYTSGVLVLSILSPLISYTLAMAAGTVCDITRFRIFSKRQESLLTFWALTAGAWGMMCKGKIERIIYLIQTWDLGKPVLPGGYSGGYPEIKVFLGGHPGLCTDIFCM